MAQLEGISLACCPEAYSESLKSFISSLERVNLTLKCMEEHVVPLMRDFLEEHSPFCILSVGSGEGYNDLSFIEMLSKAGGVKPNKPQFLERAIEPDKMKLEAFRVKVENLPENLKSRADIEFEWCPMTYQEYVEQKKKDDVKFDVVHFFHSIYYVVNIEKALEHCVENELGPRGVIFSITQDGNSPYVRYGKVFSSQGFVLSPESYYSNTDVTDVAKKNGWKYVECSGETTTCDITAIFDPSSVAGNRLLDFLTQWVNIRQTASQESLQKILNFWENESFEDGHGRKVVKFQTKTVVIFKGI